MTHDVKELTGKLVISGTLVYHDDSGQEVGRADFTMPAPPGFNDPGFSFPDPTSVLTDEQKAAFRGFAAQCMSEEERAAVNDITTEGQDDGNQRSE